MENTRENKEKFFAHYYGQKVLKVSEDATVTQKVDAYFLNRLEVYQTGHLELTPLSMISDEDAVSVTKIAYPEDEWSDNMHTPEKGTAFLYETILSDEHYGDFSVFGIENPMSVLIQTIDFLRSKGYALPFHSLSVETLISYGWLKLKTI